MYSIPLLVYDITDHCNLNCHNCNHFSQWKSKGEKSVEQMEKDFKALSNKVHVERLKLAGGEPLLHTNILNILIIARKYLGDAEITLSTNGIKFHTMPDVFFTVLKFLKIIPRITKYSIATDYDAIETKLKSWDIPYVMYDKTDFYEYPDPTGNQDPKESFRLCKEEGVCPFYANERLYACSYTFNVPFINEKFHYTIETNSVSIHDPIEVIDKYLSGPCSTCRFCKCTRESKPWRLERDKVETVLAN